MLAGLAAIVAAGGVLPSVGLVAGTCWCAGGSLAGSASSATFPDAAPGAVFGSSNLRSLISALKALFSGKGSLFSVPRKRSFIFGMTLEI